VGSGIVWERVEPRGDGLGPATVQGPTQRGLCLSDVITLREGLHGMALLLAAALAVAPLLPGAAPQAGRGLLAASAGSAALGLGSGLPLDIRHIIGPGLVLVGATLLLLESPRRRQQPPGKG
jgi:hypothetical protein